MANPSKAKGTRAETAVVNYLRACGVEAHRKPLSGSKDLGDVDVEDYCILEVKAGKMTANPNRGQLTEWWRQALAEGENANRPCALVVVRYRRAITDADVYVKCKGVKAHMYLDEFADLVKQVRNW